MLFCKILDEQSRQKVTLISGALAARHAEIRTCSRFMFTRTYNFYRLRTNTHVHIDGWFVGPVPELRKPTVTAVAATAAAALSQQVSITSLLKLDERENGPALVFPPSSSSLVRSCRLSLFSTLSLFSLLQRKFHPSMSRWCLFIRKSKACQYSDGGVGFFFCVQPLLPVLLAASFLVRGCLHVWLLLR